MGHEGSLRGKTKLSFYLLLDGPEHNKGFFICFKIKNPSNSSRTSLYFQVKILDFLSVQVSSACSLLSFNMLK